jgi:hypothetical protein
MSRSLLDDAFAHHLWATLQLIDTCLALSPAQLDAAVPATDRSILATMRHVIGSDSFDLFVASGERGSFIRADRMGLAELRAAMEDIGTGWSRLLDEGIVRSTLTTGTRSTLRWASVWRRRCTTGPTIGARSAPRSRRSVWNRRPLTCLASACRMAALSRCLPDPDLFAGFMDGADRPMAWTLAPHEQS